MRSSPRRKARVSTWRRHHRWEDDLRDAIDAAEGGRLILAGGDGSVHFALNAAERPIEIGLVPMGRANNIARSLGLPRDVPRAARVAVTAAARPGRRNAGRDAERSLLGIEGVSAGLHAAARMRYDAPDSSHLLEGVTAFAGALAAYEPWPLELELDGQLAYEGDAAGVFLSNFPLFAYGFKIDPRADIADGRLPPSCSRRRAAIGSCGSCLRVSRDAARAARRDDRVRARGGHHHAGADGLRLGGARHDDRLGPGRAGASTIAA